MTTPPPADGPLDDRSQAVLAAALRLFADSGFHGTTVPAVAEAAGVGIGTVYRRFEDKRTLVNAVYRAQLASMEPILAACEAPGTFRARHRAVFAAIFAWFTGNPAGARFMEMHHHADYLDEASRATKAALMERGARFFGAGIEAEVFKPIEPLLLSIFVWGIAMELLRGCAFGFVALTPETMAAAERCAWEAVRA